VNKQGGDFEMEGATYCAKVTKAGLCWTCYSRSYRKRTDELRAIKKSRKIRPITKIKKVPAINKRGLCAACLKEGRPKKSTPELESWQKQCEDCGAPLSLSPMQNTVKRCKSCQAIRTKMLTKIRNDKRYKNEFNK